ncbi:MAG: hypothetical protein V7603_5059 [Micromonosporaceae bacterium]
MASQAGGGETTAARVRGAGGRDRTHHRPGRPHRVNARFNAGELAELAAAATAVGMTPTGFVAEAALAAARGVPPASLDPTRENLAALQAELFDARVAVGRIGTNLNQAVTSLNATGDAPDWLARAAALCERRMQRLDDVIAAVDGQLR